MKSPTALLFLLTMTVTPARGQVVGNPHGPSISPCVTCHRANSWRPAQVSREFRHAERVFPLDGAHLRTACTACHTSLDFRKASTSCAQCHRDVHKAEFGASCGRCHTTRSFVDQTNLKRLHEMTRFPLRGAHAPLACEACHTEAQPGQSQYVRRPTTCISCHVAAYRQVRAPDHQAAQFPQDCTVCHTMSTWTGGRFDHATTKFALDGAHAAVGCQGCHADGIFRGKTTACVGCHQRSFDTSTRPPHSLLGWSTACATCHGTTAWAGAPFDHAATAFPLTGAHRTAACNNCHADGVYRARPSTCVACHQKNYALTTTPPHAASGIATTCQQCHGTTTWLGSGFDHGTTAFPLAGAHRAVACTSCHASGVYRGTSTLCQSCHQAAYSAALHPPHAPLGFSTACSACHGTSAWTGGTFDHNTTRFALDGAHRAVSCSGCHADNVYRGKSMLCASCHLARYTAATTPPHVASGFPTTCEVCHGRVAWTPATFNHQATRFPLTGSHATRPCAACHGDGVYRGKPTTCTSCHQAQYNATTNPNHKAANFPVVCESCHSTTRWTGATFNHDGTYFPIYTGKHKGRWSTCADCHTVSTNYASFSCFSCHRQTEMDSQHRGRAGYRYDSALCYQCHPQGKTP